jgi:hypothetical protein
VQRVRYPASAVQALHADTAALAGLAHRGAGCDVDRYVDKVCVNAASIHSSTYSCT